MGWLELKTGVLFSVLLVFRKGLGGGGGLGKVGK